VIAHEVPAASYTCSLEVLDAAMKESPEQRALTAAILALVAAVAGVAFFLPPLLERTLSSPLRAAATGLVLAGALLLHWTFLGVCARRMGRSVAGWVGLSVLLFPVGSAAALILLNWFSDETRAPAPAPAPARQG
jgi:drug/metabolite transporter (DMT)-like permease